MNRPSNIHNHFHPDFFISAEELFNCKNKILPKWDFHIHTNYTDGKATVNQIFNKAIEQKLEIIIFTEHTESWRSNKANWFSHYLDEIKKYRELYKNKIKAFIGVEANTISFNGDIELTAEMKENAEFILGAAHRYPGMKGKKIRELTETEAIDLEFKTLMGLATTNKVNSIAHIGGTCSKYCTPFPINLMREIIRAATQNNIAIEINPVYHKPLINFLELCAEEKAMLTMGSDAHALNEVGLIAEVLKRLFS